MSKEATEEVQHEAGQLVRHRGYFDREIFYNPINKYCVFSVRTDDQTVPKGCRSTYRYHDHMIRFTVIGYDLPKSNSVEISWEGEWKESKYGARLQVTQWEEIVPPTIEGIRNYLASGLVKGIGEKTAEVIVNRFGLATLEILEKEPERLLEIKGITEQRLEGIKQSYAESRLLRNLITLLSPFQVTPKAAQSIYQYFGAKSVDILRRDPYQLCKVPGFGFVRTDTIIRKNGGKADEPFRLRAALRYSLEEAKSKHGHLFLGKKELLENTALTLNRGASNLQECIETEQVEIQLQKMIQNQDLISSLNHIYLPRDYALEDGSARFIASLLAEEPDVLDIATPLEEVKKQLGITLSTKQELAVQTAFQNNLSIITGGPGTGKTTVLRVILEVYRKVYPTRSVLLAAPTGRASRRMAESTGDMSARTLHNAMHLGAEEESPDDESQKLEANLIIVDETSMVDQWLAKQLLSRILPGTKVILVGDADQLPSVGAGNVFHDLIQCEVIPVTTLDQIFRQGEKSRIARNAKRINESMANLEYGDDFIFVQSRDQHTAAEQMCDAYLKSVAKWGIEHVMILTPYRSEGEVSADKMNERIRELVNPPSEEKPELRLGNLSFRLYDRVMQRKNESKTQLKDEKGLPAGTGVFNGDIGTIRSIQGSTVIVDYDGRFATYSPTQLENLSHAYATTVHKAMGSEADCIIFAVLRANSLLLNRGVVYTGITRAKKQVILIGQKDALFAAIHRHTIDKRNSMLGMRVRLYCNGASEESDIGKPA